jgi:hypothetical protein
VASVVIGRRGLDRQIDETEFFVHADLRPYTDVAVDGP